MSAPKVDVLGEIKAAIKRTSPTTHFNERANLWAAHDAVAELIDAVRAAEALAVCCMAIDCYSRDELYDSAEANRAIFAKALARIGGAA